ncbi:ATP-binding cassette domain-containing protein [Paenibacillus prosopidis]|uniref:Energy-coupling factor transport system ATP-binding protein n=1 Tax=Paenibacillus prosopidis TaxID=630520 RepID=A0A368W592_9BACL|nr:ATP-binding cassette domain-containing protein [Paenibacillus prosopidis]RCW50208.1 energy-coupling factor transport system ATP-binding protein [Paenibacillus prosopidis]
MSADWMLNGVSVSADGADKRLLLNDVNLHFKAGQITLLLGRNGAGKSTLLETMAGIRTLQEGTIGLGDDSLWVSTGHRKKLNRDVMLRFGISMQHAESQWFASTVREELLYSLKPYRLKGEEANRRMEYALAEAGLATELLERDPWTLSGGQQRRLTLACLLACEPEWLLLDEPTAGLDADGVRRLCAVLEAHRAAGRGAVVATHDLDALLPLADAVAVVSGGTVREAAAAAAVAHAAAAPQALCALAELRAEAALPPLAPARSGGGAPWPEPREVAAVLAAELMRPGRVLGGAGAVVSGKVADAKLLTGAIVDDIANKQPYTGPSLAATELLRPDRFDPRALILVYLVLAASIFAQRTLLELSLAAIVTMMLLVPFRTLIWPWVRVIRAYAVLIAILCFIGGVTFTPLSFDWTKALPIVLRLGKLLLIMLLGMPMLKLMTPFRLQRSIEQSFGWLSRINVPIHSFALLVTLIFRFIPLLTGEWERFAKLAHARGKAVTALRTVPFSMLQSVMIPYVRSILRLAEQMADALEARGFGYTKRKPTYGFRLRFGRSDAILFIAAAFSSVLLFLIASVL